MLGAGTGCIGTPDQLRQTLSAFESHGVDQTIFIQQGGRNRHEDICESLELFAREVMPEFHDREEERQARKMKELAPYIDAAMARKETMAPLRDDEIPTYEAYGFSIAQTDIEKLPEANRRRILTFRRMREIAEKA